jgi:eukaryotic-like serine/threonine-protein kinase
MRVSHCVVCARPVQAGFPMCAGCGAPVRSQRSAHAIGPGTQIDRPGYRLVFGEELGRGATATVYRAYRYWDPNGPNARLPSDTIAAKVLAAADAGGARSELFVREAQIMRRLAHPSALRFLDHFVHNASNVLCTELVDGESLTEVIERVRNRQRGQSGLPCMPFLRAWAYFEQLLGALAAAHALGIVHRDIKPSNILLRRDGEVRLADFGIAVLRDHGAQGATSTDGTSLYMSPEQVMGQPVFAASDLYSAGLVLFEMLAGTGPYDTADKNEWALRMVHVSDTPRSIRQFVPQAPHALEAVFLRALHKDPAARFGSALEFGDHVRNSLNLPDSPSWRAQAALAHEVARHRGRTEAVAFSAPDLEALRAAARRAKI